MLGQGVVKDGQVSLTLGTGGFLLTTCKEVPENLDWDVVCNASSAAGNYIPVSYTHLPGHGSGQYDAAGCTEHHLPAAEQD